MIHLPASVRVYLAMTPCDMRKSFDTLHALVQESLELDAFAGHLFVFANKRRDRVKILYWDQDGFAIWAKRLESGTYAMPFREGEHRKEITAAELGALLSGIDLSQAKRRKRYQRKAASTLSGTAFCCWRLTVLAVKSGRACQSIRKRYRKIQRH